MECNCLELATKIYLKNFMKVVQASYSKFYPDFEDKRMLNLLDDLKLVQFLEENNKINFSARKMIEQRIWSANPSHQYPQNDVAEYVTRADKAGLIIKREYSSSAGNEIYHFPLFLKVCKDLLSEEDVKTFKCAINRIKLFNKIKHQKKKCRGMSNEAVLLKVQTNPCLNRKTFKIDTYKGEIKKVESLINIELVKEKPNRLRLRELWASKADLNDLIKNTIEANSVEPEMYYKEK